MPPTPHPSTERPFTIVVCESVPTSVSGYATSALTTLPSTLTFYLVGAGPDGLRQVLEVDLMADAGTRRHDAEILERALRPFEERVALLFLRIFLRNVLLECGGVPAKFTITE
jgi:hypothetical protein